LKEPGSCHLGTCSPLSVTTDPTSGLRAKPDQAQALHKEQEQERKRYPLCMGRKPSQQGLQGRGSYLPPSVLRGRADRATVSAFPTSMDPIEVDRPTFDLLKHLSQVKRHDPQTGQKESSKDQLEQNDRRKAGE